MRPVVTDWVVIIGRMYIRSTAMQIESQWSNACVKNLVFSLHLKTIVSVMECRCEGRLFQATGPAQQKPRSPNLVPVRGVAQVTESADWRPGRALDCATVVTMSVRYCGALLMCTMCMSRHSLYLIQCSMGNQCSCFYAGVTESNGFEPMTWPWPWPWRFQPWPWPCNSGLGLLTLALCGLTRPVP